MDKFRLCAFADEAGADINEQIKALKENGISLLEVRGVGDKNISQLTLTQALELKNRLEERGIAVWSIGSPIGKIGIEDDFAPHLDLFKHILEIAHTVKADCIRLFSFFIPKGKSPDDYKGEVIERLSEFCEAAKGSGVVLCHENEKGIYGDTAARCLEIHRQLPGLSAVFDPANLIQCGQDTLKAWDILSPYVKYLHIKDARTDGTVVPAGSGAGHIPRILEKFKSQGGGVLTLEPHLKVFSGLDKLEQGHERSAIDPDAFPSQRAAFDAAVSALKNIIQGM